MKNLYEQNGYFVLQDVLSLDQCEAFIAELDSVVQKQNSSVAGLRNLFQQCPAVRQIAGHRSIRNLVEAILGKQAFAVRAILFDKSPEANWYVTWHQDTFIAVKQQHEVVGYEAWSIKAGLRHVRPPAEVLESMLTVRLHLDPCHLDNGPLRVLPASHRRGILSNAEIADFVAANQSEICPVDQGGCLLMSPLLIHASSRTKKPARRRVLHLEFANCKLPTPLEWHDAI